MKRSFAKRLTALALAALLAVSATGCSGGNGADSGTGSQNSSQSQQSSDIVLTDQAGREVTLEGPAQTLDRKSVV